MKKLMMFVAAMTIVGSTFAIDVFDYKASVKNVNLKKVTIKFAGTTVAIPVYVKYVETTTLYGYLITECGVCNRNTGDGAGYLVVANKSLKVPKILPADLKAKWWNPKVNATKTYQAEGYLFAGRGKAAVPFADSVAGDQTFDGVYAFGDAMTVGAATDKLFGTYNDYEYDATGAKVAFYDAWLDAAGFGTALTDSTDGGCGVDTSCTVLSTLSGSVIGGLFLCHPNGYYSATQAIAYEGFLCTRWNQTTDVISGTWSIKNNTKLAGIAPTAAEAVTLGDATMDAFVNAAGKAIKAGYLYTSLVPADFATAYQVPSSHATDF